MTMIRVVKTDVVNGSVWLAGEEIDLPQPQAEILLTAGVAVDVSAETAVVDASDGAARKNKAKE